MVLSSRFGVVVAIRVAILSLETYSGDCSGASSSIFWNTGSDSISRVGVVCTIVLKHAVSRCSKRFSLSLFSDMEAKKSRAFFDYLLLCLPLSVFGDCGLFLSLFEIIDPLSSLRSRLGFLNTGLAYLTALKDTCFLALKWLRSPSLCARILKLFSDSSYPADSLSVPGENYIAAAASADIFWCYFSPDLFSFIHRLKFMPYFSSRGTLTFGSLLCRSSSRRL